MNAITYTYHGQAVQVLAQSDDTNLIKIGGRFVHVREICQQKQQNNDDSLVQNSPENVEERKLKLVWVRKH